MTTPILRWPGGKRRLLSEIIDRLPRNYGHMHEPFVGGGALTFALKPKNGCISDLNSELINFYTILKQSPQALIKQLSNFDLSRETFYALRHSDRSLEFAKFSLIWRAARYLFINRTCFNGMMRVNKQRALNCSHGAPIIAERVYNTDSIWQAHEGLQTINICNGPYQDLKQRVQNGDFVYLDPPYVSVRPAGDISYTSDGFGLDDQRQLAKFCDELTEQGVKWMLSNASVTFIHDLYSHYNIHEINARRSLSGNAAFRGKAREVLVTNY